MITDIIYSFNKKDYFKYFFITIMIFIFFNKIKVVDISNIFPLVITICIIYYMINNHILRNFSEMEKYNNKLKVVNVDKYKFVKKDVYIIDCIVKLENLSIVNRPKFNKFLNYTNKFFMYYEMSKAKNLRPSDNYNSAKDNAIRSINTLLSFNVDLNNYPYLEDNKEISNKLVYVNNNIDECIKIIRKRFSIFLTEIEKKINSDWYNEDNINIFSKPIYPDDIDNNIETDVLFSNRFNIL